MYMSGPCKSVVMPKVHLSTQASWMVRLMLWTGSSLVNAHRRVRNGGRDAVVRGEHS